MAQRKTQYGNTRWAARIRIHGVQTHFGMFATKEEAEAAEQEARKVYPRSKPGRRRIYG